MSRTYRSKPSSKAYFRGFRHIRSKKEAQKQIDIEREVNWLLFKHNRIYSQARNTLDPWDDIIISHYRGQAWDRAIKPSYSPILSMAKKFFACTSASLPV
jgi:hypothetical protein